MIENLPKNWSEVTLYQYQELNKSIKYDIFDELSILLNTTPDDPIIENLDWEEVGKILDKLSWLKKEPNAIIQKEIEGFILKAFNKLTLGEFIDLEYYFENKIENLHIMMAILYRSQKIDDWDHIKIEPYDYDIEERGEIFLDISIIKAFGFLKEYESFRNNFLDSYKNLFVEENNLIEDEELTGREKIEAQKTTLEEKAKSKWSWESILLGLTNNDVTKFDALLNTSLILVFNTLSAKKVLGI